MTINLNICHWSYKLVQRMSHNPRYTDDAQNAEIVILSVALESD